MKCCGTNVADGGGVEATFGARVGSVTAAAAPPDVFLAPGFIDLQVGCSPKIA
jgi:hypothetical protein